ncbi:Utp21-domain-containing protein [Wilcoxina mikolae CBS 423.85]|nr:Utp21-domain-containing protein [Wilcoxina mikolae CBS 423.85]
MPSVHPKRQRTENAGAVQRPEEKNPASKPTHSRILAPFRAIGHITSSVPFSILPLGNTFQVTTALESTVQTYDVRKLNLLFVSSPPTPGLITRVVAYKDVYAAFSDHGVAGVWIFKRGKKVGELQKPAQKWGAWKELIVFGEWVIGAFERALVVWKKEGGEVYTEIEMGGKGGAIAAVCHPSAYLNKLVVARRNGDLEIWNVKTSKKIYTILSPIPSTQNASKKITTLVQSPVISVLAIGYSTGEIHLHNIHTDTPLLTLNQSQFAASSQLKAVTSLSFCTDPFVGAEKANKEEGGGRILAVGHSDGYVTLWNLEKRRVFGDIRNAHEPSPQGIHVQWLSGQNVLVTSGADNNIKEWVFDSPHSIRPRLLRSRGGHSDSISSLAFASPGTSHFLLSASRDRCLRAQSLRNDSQSFEFSQGVAVKKATKASKNAIETGVAQIAESKAGPITAIATCAGEDGAGSTGRDWEGIVTAHQGEVAARCWSFQNKKIGRWLLPTIDGGEVKSVAVSSCGTFALVGSSKGGIGMFNLQSGIQRRRFPDPLTPAQAKQVKKGEAIGKLAMIGRGKHTKAVIGIVTDSLNRVVISSGLDGKIKFWEFTTGILIHEFNWEGTTKVPNKMKLHRPSELLAVSCDDTCIRLIDTETKKVVRELWGCEGKISDFCFSNDGRWIVAASMDSVIRIWDLPTGHLIDGVRTKNIVTALSFAGSGEFLATAHVGSVGINLWTNRTLFRHAPTRRIEDTDIVDLALPTISGEHGVGLIDAALNQDVDDDAHETGVYTTADQLSDKLLTMSLVPRTRWQTLLNLDVIRQRNKPKEAPQAPEKAPFFLPSLEKGAANTMTENHALISASAAAKQAEEAAALATDRNRIMRVDPNVNIGESQFTLILRSDDKTALLNHLKTLPPSSADLEIRSLKEGEMKTFIDALTDRLRSRSDFELVMTWMNVFLKCHGDVVTADEEEGGIRDALQEWRGVLKAEQSRLAGRVGFCLGVAEFLRSGR